jgi:hypothetical protein
MTAVHVQTMPTQIHPESRLRERERQRFQESKLWRLAHQGIQIRHINCPEVAGAQQAANHGNRFGYGTERGEQGFIVLSIALAGVNNPPSHEVDYRDDFQTRHP